LSSTSSYPVQTDARKGWQYCHFLGMMEDPK